MGVGAGEVGAGISPPPASSTPAAGTVTKLAGTPSTGYAYQNATDVNILSYTFPNDGEMHHVQLAWTILAGAAGSTGGAVRFNWTSAGQGAATSINPGTLTDNDFLNGSQTFTVDPGSTIQLQQQTAMTAGAATMYATIIGE
jgi:hypothetical protein